MEPEKHKQKIKSNPLETGEASCILSKEGIIIDCNQKAVNLYGYSHPDEVKGLHIRGALPDDLSKIFSGNLVAEYLTKGKYVERIHKKKNGELFPIRYYLSLIEFQGKRYILARVKRGGQLTENKIKELQLYQQIEVLKNELQHEKNRRLRIEGLLHHNKSNSHNSNHFMDFELISRISKKYNHLTPGDLRICSLLFLNLSSKEIAEILCLSINSVFAARKRLRKKFKLKADENLVQFIYEQFSK